jgi:hypothetical protein
VVRSVIGAKMLGVAAAWWQPLVAILASIGLGGMLRTMLDYRSRARKQTDDMATTMVKQLSDRVKAVEQASSQERALCDAQLSVLRHRMNNLAGSFDGLLLLIEMAPEKAPEFVVRIKEQRMAQEKAEAAERSSVRAAMIAAAGGCPPSDIDPS